MHSQEEVSYTHDLAGTNLQALIDAREDALKDCSIVRVISNRVKAYGLVRARNASIPTHYQ